MKQKGQARLFVAGEPGSGKTTFMKKLANDWGILKQEHGHKDQNKSKTCSVLDHFELLLLCVLRFIIPGSSLFDILRFHFDFLTATEMYACIELIENTPNKAIVLLDGLDEFVGNIKEQTYRIVMRDIFPNLLCCTTSRPETIKHLRGMSKEAVEENVKLTGFNDMQVEQYASLYFKDKTMTQNFMKHITKEKPQFLELSRIPMRAEIMVILWKKYQSLGNSLNDLYSRFTKYVLQHMEKKLKEKQLTPESDVMQKYHELLQSISQTAYSWNKDGTLKITFTEHELKEKLKESQFTTVTKSGFLSHTESKSPLAPSLWFFTHLTIQEYFVAFYLNIKEGCAEITEEFVYGCLTTSGLKSRNYIIEFLFGISTKTACNMFNNVVRKYKGDKEKLLEILVSFTNQFGHLDGFGLPLPSEVTVSNSSPNELFRLIARDEQSGNRNLTELTVLLSNETPDISHDYVTSLILEIEDGCNISKWKCNLPNLQDLTIRAKSNKITSERNLNFNSLLKNIISENIRKISVYGEDVTKVILNNLEKLKNLEFVDMKDKSLHGMKDTDKLEQALNKMKSVTCSSNFPKSCGANMFLKKNRNIVCNKVEAEFVENLGDLLIKCKQPGGKEVEANGFLFSQSDLRRVDPSVASVLLNITRLKIFGLQECILDETTMKHMSDILNMIGTKISSLKILDLSGTNLASLGQYIGECLRFLPNLDTLLLKYSNINEKDLSDMSRGYFKETNTFQENIAQLPIKYLDLSGNNINEAKSEKILFCQNLNTLTLRKCQLKGKLSSLFKKICSESLTSLNLSELDLPPEESFKKLLNHLPNLKDLNLQNCNMTEEQFSDVIHSLPAGVTNLDISGQGNITQLVTSDDIQQKLSLLHQLTLPSISQDTEKLRWLLKGKNKNLEVIVSETEQDEPNVDHGFKNIWQHGRLVYHNFPIMIMFSSNKHVHE